jgi:tungstate transport system permease protein
MDLFIEGFRGAMQLIIARDPLVIDAAVRSLTISTLAVAAAAIVGIPVASCLAMHRFFGRRLIVLLFRAGMSVPTVFIGLMCFGMFSRKGPFGDLDLLYTPIGIVIGEFFLALPIIVSWTYSAIRQLDPRIDETARTLGASRTLRAWTLVSELKPGIALALLTAFARCFTELGIATMVGGNLKYRTRTLTTATALETARGQFERGVAMSLILLAIAATVTLVIAWCGREEEGS